jgi:hypothetical protein
VLVYVSVNSKIRGVQTSTPGTPHALEPNLQSAGIRLPRSYAVLKLAKGGNSDDIAKLHGLLVACDESSYGVDVSLRVALKVSELCVTQCVYLCSVVLPFVLLA